MRRFYASIFILVTSCSGAHALQIESVQDAKLLLDGGSVFVSARTTDGKDIDVLFDSSIDTVDRKGHPLVRVNELLMHPDSAALNNTMLAFERWFDKECKHIGSGQVLENEELKCKVVFALVEAVRITYQKRTPTNNQKSIWP